MRISIFTVGTQGDIRPLVALGCGLRRDGHQVRIATNTAFRDMVTGAGLDFAPLSSDFRALMTREPEAMTRGLNPLVVARIAWRRLREAAESWVEEGQAASRDADLLIGCGVVTLLAAALAEAQGQRYVQAQLIPMTPAPDLPPVMLTPPRHPLPGPVNMLLYQTLRLAAWLVAKPAVDGVVRRRLGLSPYPWYGPYFNRSQQQRRVLYGFSRHVLPKPAAWSEEEAVTGYWFYDEAADWQPPPALARFLASGPKPVYIGFSSMLSQDAEATTALVLRALALCGRRALLVRGWGGLSDQVIDDDRVLVIGQAPHDWLFPRVALAVHHGGAGTTGAAARAGIPSVVVPFFGDQPFWGWQLNALGVAPPPLPRPTLTAEALARAIDAAGYDALCQRAEDLGRRVRAEDGVAAAIETLTQWGLLSDSDRADCVRPPQAALPLPVLVAEAMAGQ